MITEEELLEKIKALKMKFHLDLNHAEKIISGGQSGDDMAEVDYDNGKNLELTTRSTRRRIGSSLQSFCLIWINSDLI